MKIAQRLHLTNWMEDREFEKTLSFLCDHRDAVDEITLFSASATAGHADGDPEKALEAMHQESEILKRRISSFREAGFKSVGINVLVTLGHIDENDPEERPVFQKIVGWKGDVSTSCNCPNHEDFRRFTEEKYALYAEAKPDFLWVDDDIKLFWNGVEFGCFCPKCLRDFNGKNGFSYTRETLVAAMQEPGNSALRGLWVRDVRDRITDLLDCIGKAVHRVDPHLRLGFMTQRQSWSTYNGMDFPAWFRALGASMGRPGEGYYFDTVPQNVLTKAFSTAQQAYEYPETVTDVQYELENFPYETWQKSARIAVAELALAAAEGMNGALLNNSHPYRSLCGQERLYETIASQRLAWRDYLEAGRGWKAAGLYPAFSLRYDQLRTLEEGESFFTTLERSPKHDVTRAYPLAELGVPITMQASGAWGVILTGNLSQGYTDEELTDFFRGAVLVSGDAVQELERRGFGKYLGVRYAGKGGLGLVEEPEPADPVNRDLPDLANRDVHPAFFGGEAVWFEATDPSTRVVSYMRGQVKDRLGIATSLYENELGGRVCVMGYAPFLRPDDLARYRQLDGILEYLAGEKRSAKLVTPGKTAFFVREGESGVETAVMNLTLDVTERTEVAVRGDAEGYFCTPEGKIPAAGRPEADWTVFDFGPLPPY